MRILLSIGLLALSVAPWAQTVSTLTLSTPVPKDGLYVDPSGQLFASTGFAGSDIYTLAPDGTASVFATGLDGPIQIALAPDGNYYATDFTPSSGSSATVSQITPDGQRSVFATVKAGPADVVAAEDGSLYVAHYGGFNTANGNSISRIAPDGTVEDFSVGGFLAAPVGLDADDDGNLYAANIFDGRIVKVAPDGTQSLFATLPPTMPFTIGHVVWSRGRLYATYVGGHQVIAFEPDGTSSVLAGTGEPGSSDGAMASFDQPNGIAASVTGDTLFVGEVSGPANRLRIITGLAPVAAEAPAEGRGLELESLPNPFAGETVLRFRLDQAADVMLTAYDALGREVDRVAVGALAAGAQAVRWAPEALPGGVYIVRLQAGSKTEAHTVVLSR